MQSLVIKLAGFYLNAVKQTKTSDVFINSTCDFFTKFVRFLVLPGKYKVKNKVKTMKLYILLNSKYSQIIDPDFFILFVYFFSVKGLVK